MRKCGAGVRGFVLLLFGLGLELTGCLEGARECGETRTCPEPVGFIDAGNFDNWWSAGAADESRPASVAHDAGAAHEANAAHDASAGGAEERGLEEGGAGGAGSQASSEPPQLLTVSPADGASGVESDATIVLAFSAPVDAQSFAAAYESVDLPAAALTFSWNETSTVVTLRPTSPLSCETGTVPAGGGLDFLPKTYQFGFVDFAPDDTGRVLAGRTFSFSTLRKVTTELHADSLLTGNWTDGEAEGIHNCLRAAEPPYVPSVCIGDDSNNVRYTGFVSFDLSGIPGGISQFSSGRLVADAVQYGSTATLGASSLEHVAFGALDTALEAPESANLGAFYSGADLASGAYFELTEDVTSAVAEDYARRVPRSNLTQYRLGFSKIVANGSWDDIELKTSQIRLVVTYLVP